MKPGETVAQMRERLLAERDARKGLNEAEARRRAERAEHSWQQLEAERAALHPVQCVTCNDLHWLSVTDEDGRHVRLVPCHACQPSTPAQQADFDHLIDAMAGYYQEHGVTQTVLDMGDFDDGDEEEN